MKRRLTILAAFLAIAIILLMIPVIACATEYGPYTFGTNLSWKYNDSNKTLTITTTTTGTGSMPENYSPTNEPPWSNYSNSVQIIKIEEGVTSVGNYAFDNSTKITSVSFPASLKTIGDYAFSDYSSNQTTVNVNYNGVAAGWEKIAIGVGNDKIKKATIHYQTPGGNFSNLSWTLSSAGILTITNRSGYSGDQIPNYSSSNRPPWYTWREDIVSIVMEDPVTEIGEYAFSGCSNLNSITFSNNTTSIKDYAFSACSQLSQVTIPKGITKIYTYAFSDCSNLTSIDLPDSLTNIFNAAFIRCPKLTKAYYHGTSEQWSNVTVESNNENLTNALSVCLSSGSCGTNAVYALFNDGLLTVTGSGYVTSHPWTDSNLREKVKQAKIGSGITQLWPSSFDNCANLTDIELPDTLTSIEQNTFNSCWSLTGIELPNSIKSIGNTAFCACKSLTGISIPDSVTSIGQMAFMECESLRSVTLPNNLSKLEDSVFRKCTNLTSINLPDSITSMGLCAFEGCIRLEAIVLPENLTSMETGVFSGCSHLREIVIPAGITKLPGYAFEKCTNLTNVTLPSDLTEIGENVFYRCGKLTGVTLPTGLLSIGNYAFWGCSNLQKITIPQTVSTIGTDAFFRCYNLTIFGVSDTAAETYANQNNIPFVSSNSGSCGDHAVWTLTSDDCLIISGTGEMNDYQSSGTGNDISSDAPWGTNIKKLIIENGVTGIGSNAFSGCTLLDEVSLPSTLISIRNQAFMGCGALSEITIPGSVRNIGDAAFMRCGSLISISIPKSVTIISNSLFRECSALTAIELPDSVTNIKSSAFESCSVLSDITLPRSLKSIESFSFRDCNSLTSITLPYSLTNIGSDVFGSELTKLTILNPSLSLVFESNKDLFNPSRNDELEICCYPGSTAKTYAGNIGVTNITYLGNLEAYGTCGSTINWYLYKDGFLRFEGTGSLLLSGTTSGTGWTSYNNSIKSVSIGNGITELGSQVFKEFYSLTSVSIPNTVTKIGDRAFYQCQGLKSITIPDSVTILGDYAFYNTQIPEFSIPNSVTKIGSHCFGGNSRLTEITLPDSLVEIGSSPFYSCINLKTLRFPDSVTTIGSDAFYGCSSLEKVYLPHSLTFISNNIFQYAPDKLRVYYDGTKAEWDELSKNVNSYYLSIVPVYCMRETEGMEVLAEGFCDDSEKLTWKLYADGSLIIQGTGAMPDWANSTRPWGDDKRIRSVVICDGVTTVGSYAFSRLLSLESVYLGNDVTSICRAAFKDDPMLTDITLPPQIKTLGYLCFDYTPITDLVVPEGVSTIEGYALTFKNPSSSVRLPASLSSIDKAAVNSNVLLEVPCGSYALTWAKGMEEESNFGGYTVYNHKGIEEVAAEAATCETGGHEAGIICSTCGEILSGMTPVSELGHNLAVVLAKEATCTEDGNVEHWACINENCGKCFKDEEGSVELATENVLIPAPGHDWGDTSYLWTGTESVACTASHECIRDNCDASENSIGSILFETTTPATCTDQGEGVFTASFEDDWCTTQTKPAVIPALNHDFGNWTQTTDPTCTAAGEKTRSCSRCGATETQPVTALGHNMTSHAAVAATCTEPGNSAYWSCDRCEKYFSDEDGHTKIKKDSWVINALGHDFGNWTQITAPTCTAAGVETGHCSRCDETTTRSVDALSHDLSRTEEKAATCMTEGNIEYWTCSVCGKTFSDANGETEITKTSTDKAAHTLTKTEAVAATCTAEGKIEHWACSKCGKVFSDEEGSYEITAGITTNKIPNTLNKTDAREATCTAEGNIDYWTCSVCKKIFRDEQGTAEISVEATKIGKKSHTLAKTEAVAATCTAEGKIEHWTCSKCGKVFSDEEGSSEITTGVITDKISHTLNKTAAREATCTAEGNIDYWTCSVCDKIFSDAQGTTEISAEETKIKIKSHNLTKTEAVAATCTTAGNNAYWTCGTCGKHFSDAAGNSEIETGSWVIKATGHNLTPTAAKAATCTEAGNSAYWTCETCKKFFSDSEGKTEIKENSWVIGASGHSLTEIPAKAATCTEPGNSAYWTCKTCKEYFSDSEGQTKIAAGSWVTQDALGHQMTEHKAAEATCTEPGNSAYWSCERCSKYFSDASGNTEINENSWIIASPGHAFSKWAPTKVPTCTEAGEESRTCSVCRTTETRPVKATGHSPSAAAEENRIEATCTSTGSYDAVVFCSVCGEEISREKKIIGKQAHTRTEPCVENQVAGNCRDEGSYDEVVFCAVCGEEISRVKKTTGKTDVHTPGSSKQENVVAATCGKDGSYNEVTRCTTCGKVLESTPHTIAKTGSHTAGSVKQENAVAADCKTKTNGSYDEVTRCTVCGAEMSRTHKTVAYAHTPGEAGWEYVTPASCTAAGKYDEVVYCTVCRAELRRTPRIIQMLDHSLEKHERVEATEKLAGTEEYWECTGCKKKFSDAEGKNEIAAAGIIPIIEKPVTPTAPAVSGGSDGNQPEKTVDKVEAFVTRCYQVILGRDPDAGGLAYWSNNLKTGTHTADKIITGFMDSDEFRNKNLGPDGIVETLYKAMLGRGSDPDGKAFWVGQLSTGKTHYDIISGFCGSIEFGNLCKEYGIRSGAANEPASAPAAPAEEQQSQPAAASDPEGVRAFVTRCYEVILGRSPDAGGLDYWSEELLSGRKAAAEIIHGFMESDEFHGKNLSREDTVETLYRAMLDRGSDADGKAHWVGKLESGEPVRAIINGFCNSVEFRGICSRYGIIPGSVK